MSIHVLLFQWTRTVKCSLVALDQISYYWTHQKCTLFSSWYSWKIKQQLLSHSFSCFLDNTTIKWIMHSSWHFCYSNSRRPLKKLCLVCALIFHFYIQLQTLQFIYTRHCTYYIGIFRSRYIYLCIELIPIYITIYYLWNGHDQNSRSFSNLIENAAEIIIHTYHFSMIGEWCMIDQSQEIVFAFFLSYLFSL